MTFLTSLILFKNLGTISPFQKKIRKLLFPETNTELDAKISFLSFFILVGTSLSCAVLEVVKALAPFENLSHATGSS